MAMDWDRHPDDERPRTEAEEWEYREGEPRLRVIVTRDDIAPASDRWYATDRDYDLDVPVGSGPTPLAAIDDLLWRLDIEDIDPERCDIVWGN